MPACKKPDIHCTVLVLLLATAFAALPADSYAQTSGINIVNFTGSMVDSSYNVSAGIIYKLSKETRNALEQGVPMEFDVVFRIRKSREWFWDATVSEKILTFRIEYQPLGNQYLVTELYNGKRHQFRTLGSALEFIGSIHSVPLLDSNMIPGKQKYTALIKAMLNIQSLPAPLRPLAYLSPQWRLSSNWHKLEIRP